MPADGVTRGDMDDDERHRREEAERRAKRKASKQAKSAEQVEKERQRKLYRQEILQKHAAAGVGTSGATSGSGAGNNRRPPPPPGGSKLKKDSSIPTPTPINGSAFQELLFGTRAQGFQIEFRFRNAPPRPPVGPCFVGETIDTVLYNSSKKYKPLNSVEVHHTWKLHTDHDIGVPLAPSAMDLKAYDQQQGGSNGNNKGKKPLHPDDEALLNWKGSMGDTAADQLKRRQEQARVTARLVAAGRSVPLSGLSANGTANNTTTSTTGKGNRTFIVPTTGRREPEQRKKFSRVLKEEMQTWMKKTTYLSNDYSRKVHDFKSLAKTKTEVAEELQKKQQEMASRRSVKAIEESFLYCNNKNAKDSKYNVLKHPTNAKLKPVAIYPILPDVRNWGRAFTHVVVDKAPITLPPGQTPACYNNAFVTNVERQQMTSRMSCNIITPIPNERVTLLQDQNNSTETNDEINKIESKNTNGNSIRDATYYEAVQIYDLDVVPLRDDEDTPHSTFTLWLDTGGTSSTKVGTYLPIASRVALSTGRPAIKNNDNKKEGIVYPIRSVKRRALTPEEQRAMEERMAEVDIDMATKHDISKNDRNDDRGNSFITTNTKNNANGNRHMTSNNNNKKRKIMDDDDDDGEGDFGNDDSDDDDDDNVFGGGSRKTIVAEN